MLTLCRRLCLSVYLLYTSFIGDAENAGLENDGFENDVIVLKISLLELRCW